MPPKTAPARTAHWLWPPLLLLGSITALIGWLLVALATASLAGWMAPLAALEVAFMLRLGTFPRGPTRATLAVVVTGLLIGLANWGIVSAQLGTVMGLDPWNASLKMGPHLAWTLLSLGTGVFDLISYLIALAVAWLAAR